MNSTDIDQGTAESVSRRRNQDRSALSRYWHGLLRFIRTKPLGAFGGAIIVIAVFAALAAPLIAPFDPSEVRGKDILVSPNGTFWLGTDFLGRDILSRIIWGTRVSLYVGVAGMVLAITFGSALGIVSGYFGGWVDLIAQRFVDALIAFPSLLLAVAIMGALGQSLNNVVLAIVIVFIPRVSRVIRSEVLSIKKRMYIDSARAIGASFTRITFLHILPNTFAPLIIVGTSLTGAMIIIEASLSFLSVGTPSSTISWGSMLGGDTQAYFATASWIAIFPGLALITVVFGMNILGDALRDVLDPRLRGTR